jgi:FMN phosphatase YigB (HAD superfamily)
VSGLQIADLMSPDQTIRAVADPEALRGLLLDELAPLRQRMEAIRARWEAVSREAPIPVLSLPFGFPEGPDRSTGPCLECVPEDTEVVSLDIFDTCLRRISGDPMSVFRMLEAAMAAEGLRMEGFARIRMETENRVREAVRQETGRDDIPLESIYEALSEACAWSPDQGRYWMERECALELAVLRPNLPVRQLAWRVVESGKPLIYVTDMYLPEAVLEEALRRAGFPFRSGCLFSSGRTGCFKGSGKLFAIVREHFPDQRICHIGDNPHADNEVPAGMGIDAPGFQPPPRPHRDSLSLLLHELAAGEPPETGYWERLGYTTVGPMAVAWMLDVIRQSRETGLERVAFLTRDGYFPKKAFDQLAPRLGVETDSLTCYSSRRLLGIASMERITAGDWDFLLKPAPGMRIRDFFLRVGLGPDLYEPACARAGIDPGARVCHHRGFHEPETKDRLYGLFLEMMDAFYAFRDGLRGRYLDYLTAIDLCGRSCALVDIGWNGSSFNAFQRLLGPEAPGRGFYFALWSADRPEADGRRPFLINGESAAAEERLIRGGVGLLEFLLGSPHDSVVDLSFKDGSWEPVYLHPGTVGPYERAAYAGIEAGFQLFLERFVAAEGFLAPGDGKGFLRQRLQTLLYRPGEADRAHLGAVSHCEGWGLSRRFRLLPRDTVLENPETARLAYAYSAWKGAWR